MNTTSTSSRRIDRVQMMPFWLRLVLITTILMGGFQIYPQSETIVLAQGAPCVDVGPGTYVAHLCLTAPADGATLTGDVTATITVSTVSGSVPPVKTARFYLNRTSSGSTSSLAADISNPYTIQVPTYRFVDGSYRLEAAVTFNDNYTTATKARLLVTLSNGVTQAPHTGGSWAPKTSGDSPLNIVAIGDGAGGLPGATNVANLATSVNPDLLLYLGDVYNSGTYTEFYNWYGPTLGPLNSRTNPVPGNHESGNNYQGYMDYWDMDEHYYSYDSGGWHFIALDSTSDFGQTGAGTAQYNWLSQDLQANASTTCTLVYFHHPRHGMTSTSGNAYMQDIWSLLAVNGVDVVLSGHEHNYQRWMPMNAAGDVTTNGMIQYVAGTGGHELMGFNHSDSRVAYRLTADGVLSLTLGAGGGSSRFISTGATTVDESSFNCHDDEGTATPTPPDPTTPLTLMPVADAMVAADAPDANYGKTTSLRADQSPLESSYLRFDVEGLTEPASRATLRMYVRDGTQNGPSISRSSNTTWSETGITWSNKPAVGTPFADVGPVSTGSWVEYDVTSQITGNGPVTFALTAQTTDALSVGSRESSTFEPQLIIERGGGVTPTPTTTPSPTPEPGTVFLPAADARVEEANPSGNFGTSTVLRTESGVDPDIETYLRFTVTNVTGTPTGATLRLFVPTNSTAGTVNGPSIYSANTSSWSETGISWSNRPARGATALDDLGATFPGTWVELDVSAVVTGNGTYSFVLATTSADAADFASRETATAPQLVLHGTTSTGTPTPTVTATATPTATVSPTATATTTPGSPTILEPVADAMVSADNPTVNYGSTNSLHSDQSPEETSFIRFDVQGLSGPAQNATLRLWVRNGTVNAPAIAVSSNDWDEQTITWSTKPEPGTVVADLGPVSTGTWIEYDVSSAITGNGPITFALIPQTTDALSVTSRNSSSDRPQLVIGQSTSGATSTPTPTSTAVTPSPTATVTTTSTTTPGGLLTFGPVADTRVSEAQPTTNYGKQSNLRADGSPQEISYLRFNVQGLSGSAPDATLRLNVRDGTTDAATLVMVSDTSWDETTMTWGTRPATGTVISDLDAVSTGDWIEYDVSGIIPGNGLISFALVSDSSDALSVNSKEASTGQPELIVGRPANNALMSVADTGSEPSVSSQRQVSIPTPTPEVTPADATPTAAPSLPTATPELITLTGTISNTGGQDLRCRVDASLDSEIIVMLPEGTVVAIRGPQEGDWLPVTCDGQDGYVAAAYVTVNATEGQVTEAAPTTPTPDAVETPSPTSTAEAGQPGLVAIEITPAPTETTVVEPTATEPEEIEPTPLPIVNGWPVEPNVPWWFVTDDDPNTVWSGHIADQNNPVEFGFDLGNTTPVSHLRWNPTWPLQGEMEIQLSNDGTSWYRLTTIHLDQQLPDEWSEIPVHTEARFINFVFTLSTGTGDIGTINDIEVWAETSGVAGRIDLLPLIVPTPTPPPPTEEPTPTELPVLPTEVPPEPTPTLEVIPTSVPVEPTLVPEPTQAPEPEPVETETAVTPPPDAPVADPNDGSVPDGG